MSSLDKHIKHKYCVELVMLPNDELLLTIPANRLLNISKKVSKISLLEQSMTIETLEPIETLRKLDIGRDGQAALINIYIAVEQIRREMNTELFKVYDTDNKPADLFGILNLDTEEKTANTALMWSILSGELPDTKLTQSYNLIKKYISEN